MWYVGVWCIGFWGQFTPSPHLCSENLKSGSLCHWSITNQVQAPLVLRHLSERISADFKDTETLKKIFEYWNVASTTILFINMSQIQTIHKTLFSDKLQASIVLRHLSERFSANFKGTETFWVTCLAYKPSQKLYFQFEALNHIPM